ncbi:hypothetical protein Lal_00024917 [Lupinus albus]|uniref:Putative chromatin regulator PHD family n=1 Tax=Lupinus albus TaxID=3870 RepID=A0A6A5NWV5_LUPAL|nr:putative chromatin regulator PHD family [Lupinus albus]KAF1889590.1 hypothetical protein Lal_00024917 [Lupinus albus]
MTSKETNPQRQSSTECCMCGDPGFSDQIFQCKVCQFRSQHRYCSNIYPNLESLGTCNWCLSQKESDKSPNSSNSSSPYSNNNSPYDENNKNKKIKKGLRGSTSSALQLQLQKKPIKKLHKSPEAISPVSISKSPSSQSVLISTRKRIITNGALEERLRRINSEDITNTSSGTPKQIFRNKLKRYKLLDEVSS